MRGETTLPNSGDLTWGKDSMKIVVLTAGPESVMVYILILNLNAINSFCHSSLWLLPYENS